MGVPGLFAFLSRRYPFFLKTVDTDDPGDKQQPWGDGVDELYIGASHTHIGMR